MKITRHARTVTKIHKEKKKHKEHKKTQSKKHRKNDWKQRFWQQEPEEPGLKLNLKTQYRKTHKIKASTRGHVTDTLALKQGFICCF